MQPGYGILTADDAYTGWERIPVRKQQNRRNESRIHYVV